MSCKRSTKVIISLLTLSLAYLKQDITMAIGQPVLLEAKADMAPLEQGQATPLIESVRLNPFLSFEEERNFLAPKRLALIVLDYLNLSATFCSPEKTNSKAIINGMICRMCDVVEARDGKKIVEIHPQAVILRDMRDVEYIVTLYK